MGPFQMWDLVGLDVLRDDPEKNVRGEMVRLGRLGQKKDGGYYDYDAQRKPTLSPVAMEIIESIAGERGVQQREQPSADEVLARVRSEERRVGKEGGRTCRSRWAPD